MHIAKTSFNAGLLSPQVDMRQDAASYANGCRVLRNFRPHIAGGLSKRPGLRMVMPVPHNKVSHLVPFNYSTDTRFVLVFRDGFFRVLKEGKEVVAFNGLSTPPDAWSGTTRAYNAGDWVTHNDNAAGARDTHFYPAAITHSAAPGNEPPSSSWRVTYISAWAASTAYVVGSIITSGGLHYACKTAHTSAGSFSATNWNVLGTTRLSLWVPNATYQAGDLVAGVVLHSGRVTYALGTATVPHINETFFIRNKEWGFADSSSVGEQFWNSARPFSVGDFAMQIISGKARWFRCIVAHTSTPTNAPGTTGGASKWLEVTVPQTHAPSSFVYLVGDYVKVGANVFVCTAPHTSSTTNTPISTNAPWKLIEGVRAWASTGSKSPGDVVVYGRDILACAIAHTTTTFLTWAERIGNQNGDKWRNPASETGVTLPSYWESTRIYKAGEVVRVGAAPNEVGYVCVEEHTVITGLQPGTAAGNKFWQKIPNWAPVWTTGTNYQKGAYVAGYKVTADYTSSTSLDADISNGDLVDSGGVPFEAQTVYGESALSGTNTVQVNDLLWALNPAAETQLIQRTADNAWKFSPVPWDFPPTRDENTDESTTLAVSAVTGDVTLTSSKGLFQPGMVGGYFALSHRRDDATTKLVLNAVGNSPVLRMVGRWDLLVFGNDWTGEIALQTSKDGVNNWSTLRTWVQPVPAMRTIATSGTVTEETYFRLRKLSHTAGDTTNYAVLEAADSRITGALKITEVQSSTMAKGTVVRDFYSTTATSTWSEGAYSNYRGWPRAGTLHELRIFLAGCEGEPQTLRASRTDDFFQFEGGMNDNDSLSLTIASKESNPVQWVEAVNGVLVVATLGEVWSVDSGTDNKGMTPTNPPRVKMQSRSGSAALWAKLIGESLVYLQRDTRVLREFIYSFDRNKFVAPSLVSMADSVLASGVKQYAVIQQPEPTLFCVMNDGRLLSFTFDKDHGVTAWAEHLTEGSFESVATTYGGKNVADEVWFVVKRDIGGTEVRFIEQFDPLTLQGAPYSSPNKLFYTDCSIHVFNETATNTIVGLDHLNGATVMGIADGAVFGPVVVGGVTGGIGIVLGVAATDVVVGLPYTAQVQGMKLDFQTQSGTIQGQQQKLGSAHVRIYESSGAEHNSNPDDPSIPWSSADMGDITNVGNRQVDPKDFRLDTASRYRKEINLSLRSSFPLPFNILGIVYDFDPFDHS